MFTGQVCVFYINQRIALCSIYLLLCLDCPAGVVTFDRGKVFPSVSCSTPAGGSDLLQRNGKKSSGSHLNLSYGAKLVAEEKCTSRTKGGWKKPFFIVLIVSIVVIVAMMASVESYTGTSGFCGTSCHIMDPAYQSWKGDKHGEKAEKQVVACVQCHYAPGERKTFKAKSKGLGQLFTFLATDEKEIRKATHIDDRSCMTSECHPQEKYFTKKIKYTDREGAVPFEHKTHQEKTIEGQVLHCNSCHQQVAGSNKHFEVSKDLCYTCHFRHSEFNKSLAKCELCHAIPTKPLQKQKSGEEKPGQETDQPITHQSLAEKKVPCASCHLEIVAGTDDLKPQACQACHSNSAVLAKKHDLRLMHEKHVAEQKAGCLDCHIPKQHKKIDYVETVRQNCSACHSDPHLYQAQLIKGPEQEGVPETPGLMHEVTTNCLACHVLKKNLKGTVVIQGDAQTCVSCHKEGHLEMVERWKKEIAEGLKQAVDLEKEAFQAIEKAKADQLTPEVITEATALYEKGLKDLHLVQYGNGVHNKKYSLMVLNNASINFEDAAILIEDEQ